MIGFLKIRPNAGSSPPAPTSPLRWEKPGSAALAIAGLIFAGAVAYHNTFTVPFFFDDIGSITKNESIRHLWPPWGMLSPPSGGQAVAHRPFANVSFALNYAMGGLRVEGYHAFNLAMHLLAGVALYGIVRRTLLQPVLRETYGAASGPLAWLSALWWLVHPLLTESVTCVVQRTEVLMGLFYLATLYAAIRAMGSVRPGPWKIAATLACLAGMGTKEVMVSAPLMVFLYDRTFVAGSFRAAWKERRWFYLSLAMTWVLLAWLVLGGGGADRGGTAGFSDTIPWWQYLFTQFYAIVRYLKLSVWPHPLVFDYGTYLVKSPAMIISCGLLVALFGTATAIAIWRLPALGFLGAWFFAILAPSSSIVPVITETMAEKRMYLALPAVLVALVLGLYRWSRGWLMPIGLAVAVAGIGMTVARNSDYRSARSIWADTVAHWPGDPRPHINLGTELISDPSTRDEAVRQMEEAVRLLKPESGVAYAYCAALLGNVPGHEAEAVSLFQIGLRSRPDFALGHLNYGRLLGKLPGREADAIAELKAALILQHGDISVQAEAHTALGALYLRLPGRRAEGIAELREAIRLEPDLSAAHADLGAALADEPGGLAEAVSQLETARDLDPDSAEVWNNLGLMLYRAQRLPEALNAYLAALRLQPDYALAHYNLGVTLLDSAQPDKAAAEFEKALGVEQHKGEVHLYLGDAMAELKRDRDAAEQYAAAAKLLEPGDGPGWLGLGVSLVRQGQFAQAAAAYSAAARAEPANPKPIFALGNVLAAQEQYPAAATAYRRALALAPDLVEARNNLGNALLLSGQVAAAVAEYREALRQRPGDPAIAESLRRALEMQGGAPAP
jgi:tetratricopeptide (TPR) repeat protein